MLRLENRGKWAECEGSLIAVYLDSCSKPQGQKFEPRTVPKGHKFSENNSVCHALAAAKKSKADLQLES